MPELPAELVREGILIVPQGRTQKEKEDNLREELENSGINTSYWAEAGKGIPGLLEEMKKGECQLKRDGNKVIRIIYPVLIKVVYNTKLISQANLPMLVTLVEGKLDQYGEWKAGGGSIILDRRERTFLEWRITPKNCTAWCSRGAGTVEKYCWHRIGLFRGTF